MGECCPYIEQCIFFKQFRCSAELDCSELIRRYCRGPRAEACARRRILDQGGARPPQDLLPSGHRLPPR